MRVLYVGDFVKLNGPSVVDVSYKEELNKVKDLKLFFFQANDYFGFFKLFIALLNSDRIIVSGVTGLGSIAVFIASLFKTKKTFYLCHGLLKYESNYNYVSKKRFLIEKILFKKSSKIFTVSNVLKEYLLDLYEVDRDKVYVQYNGFDFNSNEKLHVKDRYSILSVGGGRKQKKILDICKAIKLSKYSAVIDFLVVGEDAEDTDEIKKYSFVKYYGFISKKELNSLYKKISLFVLISSFESFSSAFFEAVQYRCSILVSTNTGGLELILDNSIKKSIEIDSSDYELMAKKIDYLLESENAILIHNYILSNKDYISWEFRVNELLIKIV